MTKDEMMKTVFWYCVDTLNAVSSWLGVTYEELNIWIFVIVHPMVTISLLVFLWMQKSAHYRHLKSMML
ncbi:MAG: hypothetical protein CBB97_00565 [Candidatus Endolissoclinum sp. TMED37]|nr:MAG: hypothetical protein CBB97_00565 [Candidatus Endolissoclinum sp. TMED37]